MAEVTASMVKELRDRTGAGMMEAKKALVAAGGNIEGAIQALRESGAVKAEKKAARETNEGRVAGFANGTVGAMVELLCETDFVAKNADFVAFAEKIAESVAKAPKSDDYSTIAYVDGGTLADAITSKVATIGENLRLGNVTRMEQDGSFYGMYIHHDGKTGVLTQIKGEQTPAGTEVAKEVAVHAAFTKPVALRRSDVPADIVAKEREVFEALVRNEGKPENLVPKIVEGKINGFFKQCVLLEQGFVKDDKKSVDQLVKGAGSFELTGYALHQIG